MSFSNKLSLYHLYLMLITPIQTSTTRNIGRFLLAIYPQYTLIFFDIVHMCFLYRIRRKIKACNRIQAKLKRAKFYL